MRSGLGTGVAGVHLQIDQDSGHPVGVPLPSARPNSRSWRAIDRLDCSGASNVASIKDRPAAKTEDEHASLSDAGRLTRRLPIGAEVMPGGGVHFRVWAPKCEQLHVVFESTNPVLGPLELALECNGYYSGVANSAGDGALYRFRTENGELYPDPASRFQPHGPHGPSQVVDPSVFTWHDQAWLGLRRESQVFYELHLGTFTSEGTWSAAAGQLQRLLELGVTVIEIMPVAEFVGEFGWGYDGVDLFAPYHVYGAPDEMRRFIDRAHQVGLGVILDVVYNHFGPDGCYHHALSDHYLHEDRRSNDWGDALNFDGPGSGPVREYFVTNAECWISEYHLDGLRLDATHAIHDCSPQHILAQMSRKARAAGGTRSLLLLAENEAQNMRLLRPHDESGYGLDGVWNDDFHHSARVALTGHTEAYYCDYRGTPQELISAVKWGYLFQGQFCKWQQKLRGTSALGIPASRFLSYLENHDQVANSARGLRLKSLTSPARYRAMVALWLLSPQTPLLFQGQELGSNRPFLYFSDQASPLASQIRAGRAEELAGFRSTTHSDLRAFVIDPVSRSAFQESKLEDAADYRQNPTFLLFQDLLRLRREDPIFRMQRSESIHGAVLGSEAFALRFLSDDSDDRLVLVNLGRDLYPLPSSEPLLAPPEAKEWSLIWYSEHPRYEGSGIAPPEPDQPWRLSGGCTLVLAAQHSAPRSEQPEMGSTQPVDYEIHPAIRRKGRENKTRPKR
jgi:maltooligosyltrehalose trehalohydrolase